MNVKTHKTTDHLGRPNGGVLVEVDVNGTPDALSKQVIDPTVNEVDLGNGVKARDVFGIGSKVISNEELLDMVEDYIKRKSGHTPGPKGGLKKRADL